MPKMDTTVTNGNYGNGMFARVAAAEMPTAIKRSGRDGKWTQAVALLRECAVGDGLSITLPQDELASARTGVTGAVRRVGKGLQIATRTQMHENEGTVTLYIIRKPDAVEGAAETGD